MKHLVELTERQVAHRLPALAAIVGNGHAAVLPLPHASRVERVDPQRVVVGVHAAGAALVLLAWWRRRAAAVDPVERARHRDGRALRQRIGAARGAADLSGALRQLAAISAAVPRADLDDVLRALDDLSYAPGATGADVDDRLRARATALADRMVAGRQVIS